MPDEFAELWRSAAADFDAAFGSSALYTPPGGGADPTPCVVTLDASDETTQLGASSFIGKRRVVEVRVDALTPDKGGKFLLGDETLTITARPKRLDPEGMWWTCLCDPS